MDAPAASSVSPRRDPRLRLLIAAFAVLVVANNIGSITAPTLVTRSPELLLALSARIRHLLFSVPAGIHPVPYAAIGGARLLAAATISYLLGRHYGDRGFAWLERQMGTKQPATFRWMRAGATRAAIPLVMAFPASNLVCALVGTQQMAPRRFLGSIVAGIGIRLTWVWIAARLFEDLLTSLLDWIERYQWWLVGAFFLLTMAQSWRRAASAGREPPGAAG